MQDFDVKRKERAARDRSFQLGGETFVMKVGVRPEVLAAYDDINEGTTAAATIAVMDEVVLGHIEDVNGSHERWKWLRTREEDPITIEDLGDLVQWLLESQTGRPTSGPSASGPGPASRLTGMPSTGGSFSQEIPEEPAA